MWSVKYPPVIEKPDAQARAFSLCNFRTQGYEQSLNISPADIAADRTLENEQQGFRCFAFMKA